MSKLKYQKRQFFIETKQTCLRCLKGLKKLQKNDLNIQTILIIQFQETSRNLKYEELLQQSTLLISTAKKVKEK